MKIKESEKIDEYLDLTKETRDLGEHEGGGDTNSNWCTWNGHHGLGKETGGIGNHKEESGQFRPQQS